MRQPYPNAAGFAPSLLNTDWKGRALLIDKLVIQANYGHHLNKNQKLLQFHHPETVLTFVDS